MPRLRQVPRSEVEDPLVDAMYSFLFADRDPVAEPGTTSGSPGDWWTVFAAVPDIFKHAVDGIQIYRSGERHLDPLLRELGQCRSGWIVGSQFVYSQHCKSLRLLGVDEEKIEAVAYWPGSDRFDDAERAVLGYVDAMASDHGRVHDGLFEALRRHLDDHEILELTYICGLYIMHGIMSRALRTEWDDRDDPVVEVDGPAGFTGYDRAAEAES
ncbi:MAG: carboxymuconolactone decarboxylase family protein [Microthrixaceae bacterium]